MDIKLALIRKENGKWVVDEDSLYLFEQGREYENGDRMELKLAEINPMQGRPTEKLKINKLNSDWYAFYTEVGSPVYEVKIFRLSSDCLGNAQTTAEELANRCNIILIGVAKDLGVAAETIQ